MKSIAELRAAIVEAGDDISDQGVDGVIALIRKIIREDLMGLAELRTRLGVSANAANMRTWRGSIPPPAAQLAYGRVWLRPDIEEWIEQNPHVVRHDSLDKEVS